ncbi:hypothetical protein DL98DRAFT_586804 [Cadophora sp. DSE1049]|jgi:hypothetical protein|nr:hypothetical protein DL98DRAFT_586804 [Cadophora sp. DSE1049]
MTGIQETPASTPASTPTSTPTSPEKVTGTNQPEEWLKPDSIFYDPTLPNNVGLPPPRRTQLPPNDQIPLRRYNPLTGGVTLEPYPPNNLPVRLGIKKQKS